MSARERSGRWTSRRSAAHRCASRWALPLGALGLAAALGCGRTPERRSAPDVPVAAAPNPSRAGARPAAASARSADPTSASPAPTQPAPASPARIKLPPASPAPGSPAPGSPAPGSPAPGSPAPAAPTAAGPAPAQPTSAEGAPSAALRAAQARVDALSAAAAKLVALVEARPPSKATLIRLDAAFVDTRRLLTTDKALAQLGERLTPVERAAVKRYARLRYEALKARVAAAGRRHRAALGAPGGVPKPAP